MHDPAATAPDQLLADMRQLCAEPSSVGHAEGLAAAARVVAMLLRQTGLHVKVVRTAGAPVVLGWRDAVHHQAPEAPPAQSDGNQAGSESDAPVGRVLLYHHYDTAPTGPWREWYHEPFQLAERDQQIYGRGVAAGKGPLAAHLHALRLLLAAGDTLPHGLAVVVEGEGLSGSPHLAEVLANHQTELQPAVCLSVGGELDSTSVPFCYMGSKGLLRVQLKASGPAYALASGMAASVPNPIWRLIWALNQIKGEDEDIRINGFYDSIAGASAGERVMLRMARLAEADRLDAWKIPAFLFEMSDTGLVRSEVTLPTCHLSSFVAEPARDVAAIPVSAVAQIEFQLVPDQHPDQVIDLLRAHLHERGYGDIEITPLPGSYGPARHDGEHPFVQRLVAAGQHIYGRPLPRLPLGAFAQPLRLLSDTLDAPAVALALARASCASYGPNEHVLLDDLLRHSQLIAAVLATTRAQRQVLLGAVELNS